MTPLERFLGVMEYQKVDRVPNWELGIWAQARALWESESAEARKFHWGWFSGEEGLGMDPREFIRFTDSMMPPFEHKTIEEDEETLTFRDGDGRIRKALKTGSVGGSRMSMDEYIDFPIKTRTDWEDVKRRYTFDTYCRYEPNWKAIRAPHWPNRKHPLIFGPNCTTHGFYWKARDWMGTEELSYAWYDQPQMLHDMMNFWADFLIEAARPVLEHTTVEYICLNEDLAMKTGPLLSPDTYRTFILPNLKKVVSFYKSHGVRYVAIDTDGNSEPIVPMMMDVGVDIVWPLERAADQDPVRLRKKFGKSLRLWGGVDKREIAKGPAAIDAHLRAMQPLIEDGGFIPTVDHTVPPDVSWPNFQHYWASKKKLLEGKL